MKKLLDKKWVKVVGVFIETIIFVLVVMSNLHFNFLGKILIPIKYTLVFGILEIIKSILIKKKIKVKKLILLILEIFVLNFLALNIRNSEYLIALPFKIILWSIYIFLMFKIFENNYLDGLIENSDNKKEEKKQLRKERRNEIILVGIKTLLISIFYILLVKFTFYINIAGTFVADLDNDGIVENIEIIEKTEKSWSVFLARMDGMADGPSGVLTTCNIKINNKFKYKFKFGEYLDSCRIEDFDRDGKKEIVIKEGCTWPAFSGVENLLKYDGKIIERVGYKDKTESAMVNHIWIKEAIDNENYEDIVQVSGEKISIVGRDRGILVSISTKAVESDSYGFIYYGSYTCMNEDKNIIDLYPEFTDEEHEKERYEFSKLDTWDENGITKIIFMNNKLNIFFDTQYGQDLYVIKLDEDSEIAKTANKLIQKQNKNK